MCKKINPHDLKLKLESFNRVSFLSRVHWNRLKRFPLTKTERKKREGGREERRKTETKRERVCEREREREREREKHHQTGNIRAAKKELFASHHPLTPFVPLIQRRTPRLFFFIVL